MAPRTGRSLATLGVILLLAALYILSRKLLAPTYLVGLLRAVVTAVTVWALIMWLRPGR